MTDDMLKEHLARAHLAESVTMDAETWTEVLQELQQYRQTIHQAEQAQPVAWGDVKVRPDGKRYCRAIATTDQSNLGYVPLYTAQPQRQWVGLTDDEIKEIIGPWGETPIKGYTRKMFDQIEAKLQEKNR